MQLTLCPECSEMHEGLRFPQCDAAPGAWGKSNPRVAHWKTLEALAEKSARVRVRQQWQLCDQVMNAGGSPSAVTVKHATFQARRICHCAEPQLRGTSAGYTREIRATGTEVSVPADIRIDPPSFRHAAPSSLARWPCELVVKPLPKLRHLTFTLNVWDSRGREAVAAAELCVQYRYWTLYGPTQCQYGLVGSDARCPALLCEASML